MCHHILIIHVIFFRKYETKICDDEGFRKEIERDSYTIWMTKIIKMVLV